MDQKQQGWGRKAIERFKVDKEAQIEALKQIGIDVALYQEPERKAALEVSEFFRWLACVKAVSYL